MVCRVAQRVDATVVVSSVHCASGKPRLRRGLVVGSRARLPGQVPRCGVTARRRRPSAPKPSCSGCARACRGPSPPPLEIGVRKANECGRRTTDVAPDRRLFGSFGTCCHITVDRGSWSGRVDETALRATDRVAHRVHRRGLHKRAALAGHHLPDTDSCRNRDARRISDGSDIRSSECPNPDARGGCRNGTCRRASPGCGHHGGTAPNGGGDGRRVGTRDRHDGGVRRVGRDDRHPRLRRGRRANSHAHPLWVAVIGQPGTNDGGPGDLARDPRTACPGPQRACRAS